MLGSPITIPTIAPRMIAVASRKPPACWFLGSGLSIRRPLPPAHARGEPPSGERAIHGEDAAIGNLGRLSQFSEAFGSGPVHIHVHVDRAAFNQAAELMARFGEHALSEAAAQAENSRAVGNVIHFCRWRQIERTIEMLSSDEVLGAVH